MMVSCPLGGCSITMPCGVMAEQLFINYPNKFRFCACAPLTAVVVAGKLYEEGEGGDSRRDC